MPIAAAVFLKRRTTEQVSHVAKQIFVINMLSKQIFAINMFAKQIFAINMFATQIFAINMFFGVTWGSAETKTS